MKPLTKEQREARRRAAREWKQRNKNRRTADGYGKAGEPRLKKAPSYKSKRTPQRDEWWEALKKKHAGKPRLEKSILPPLLLNLHEDEAS